MNTRVLFLSLILLSIISHIFGCAAEKGSISHKEGNQYSKSFDYSAKADNKQIEDYLKKLKSSSELVPKDSVFEKAYQLYEKAKATSTVPEYFNFFGTEDKKGIEYLKEAIKINPYYHAAYYLLGLSCHKIKDIGQSEKYLLRSIELKPKYGPGYTSLADLYYNQERYEEAIDYYGISLAYDKNNFDTHFNIAGCYYHLQKWNEAEKWYLKASDINPESPGCWHYLGVVYLNMERYEEAIMCSRKALDINPDNKGTKKIISWCQSIIDRRQHRRQYLKGLNELLCMEGNIGILARLLLCLNQYNKANYLWIKGRSETTPVYETIYNKKTIVDYNVSSKIYEAQGHFEKIKADLKKITSAKGEIKEALNLFLFAVEQRISGIEQHSKGYYTKAEDYKGEYEKGLAKTKLADAYLVDGLKILRDEIAKYKSYFGNIADQDLKSYIERYEKINR